jgi:formamidopyrimidine-DNA glycosylase
MPELPEVETIRRQLSPIYKNELITQVRVKKVRIFQNVKPAEFSKSLRGKKIIDIDRYGKFLIFDYGDIFAVFHLGMSGVFLKDRSASKYPQHIHVKFYFDSGKEIHFQDVRKFSKIWLFDEQPEFPGLGIDPTTQKFTLNNFQKLLNLRQVNVKSFLMNQSNIAGIGNIYANEILFNAGISPLRKLNKLTEGEIIKLYSSIKLILNQATKKFGTSYSAYRTVSGEQGTNQHFLKVYQRYSQNCFKCNTIIEKVIIDSRSTFYCPNCQK